MILRTVNLLSFLYNYFSRIILFIIVLSFLHIVSVNFDRILYDAITRSNVKSVTSIRIVFLLFRLKIIAL